MNAPRCDPHELPPITVSTLRRMKETGEKIACLTAYDATFAARLEEAGVEVLLVGDSLGMVVQGQDSTVRVRLRDMVYHSRCVARGCRRALLVVDMPFLAYSTAAEALHCALRLMRDGGAQVVKLEGGRTRLEVVRRLSEEGVSVCGHLGLLPQSIHRLGGYRVQGRERVAAEALLEDACALEAAGATMLVLECIPSVLAREVSESVRIPVIGIGAGPDCDGQVLVLYDVLGITRGRVPRFARDFMAETGGVPQALAGYVRAVKSGAFPRPEHCYA